MRVAFIGASALTATTARLLIARNHEVIIVERDKERIQELSADLDCGFVHGNGARPNILKELDPENLDLLFCLTESDEINIIASLVGRSLGLQRVVTRIGDPEFEHVCLGLGLEDVIVPSRTIARHLAEMASGRDALELSALLHEDMRLFGFVASSEDEMSVAALKLPEQARVMYLRRGDKLLFANPELALRTDDEVVLIAHRSALESLQKRWGGST
jgi:trk/ktr system potassium uptake protein